MKIRAAFAFDFFFVCFRDHRILEDLEKSKKNWSTKSSRFDFLILSLTASYLFAWNCGGQNSEAKSFTLYSHPDLFIQQKIFLFNLPSV